MDFVAAFRTSLLDPDPMRPFANPLLESFAIVCTCKERRYYLNVTILSKFPRLASAAVRKLLARLCPETPIIVTLSVRCRKVRSPAVSGWPSRCQRASHQWATAQ